MREKEHFFSAAFTFVASFVVYVITLAPSVSLWDCGEFITSSVTLGVPHPPGAPFYLLIGRVFSMLPFGSDMAYRVNLISPLTSALSIMFLYLIIVRLIKEYYGKPKEFDQKIIVYGGGIIGALTFAFTETFWFNATEAEVYAVSMLVTVLPLYLAIKWMGAAEDSSSLRLLVICAYISGLAVGVHLLNLLVLPSIFLLIYFYNRKLLLNVRLWGIVAVVLIAGFSTYMIIYIRANLGPFLNENDPSNFERFMSYWNREQYGRESLFLTFFERKASFWAYQVKKMYLRYFAWNFMGNGTTLGPDRYIIESFSPNGLLYMPFLLGIAGLYFHFKKDWRRALAILVMFIMTGIAIVIYLNQPDPQPRERDYVYVGSFFAFAIWIGIGFAAILEKVIDLFRDSGMMKNIAMGTVVGFGIVMGPFIEFNHNFDRSDRRGLYFASDYSYNILATCEENAILFTNGDNDTFPLWYLQAVEGVRRDVTVVNLSLLNTNWYIKQLKYGNPIYDPLPITLDDDRIEGIGPMQWNAQTIRVPVPADVYNSFVKEIHPIFGLTEVKRDTAMTFTVKPTLFDRGLRVQDFMIVNIIYANQWKRPVYFAMTVPGSNKAGLEGNLRIDGMAFKLVPYGSQYLAPDVLTRNLLERYHYRGFDDPEVYYNVQKRDLFQNLRTCFLVGADFYWRNNMYDEMLKLLEAQDKFMPEDVLPIPNFQFAATIARMYDDGGRKDVALEKLQRVIEREDVNDDVRVEIAQVFMVQMNAVDRAIEVCEEVLARKPFHTRAYSLLISLYDRKEDYSSAVELLDKWLEQSPADSGAISMREKYKALSSQADTTAR